MTIGATLSSALSGLTAASRAAQAISDNVANVLTPGYGVRGVSLAAGANGGVSVTGVSRREDLALLTDSRQAEAGAAATRQRTGQISALRTAVGPAGSGRSISDRMADFDARLVEAASQPSSETRLGAAFASAQRLVEHINAAGAEIQSRRSEVDGAIGKVVGRLNEGLAKIEDLNERIAVRTIEGEDTNALRDRRSAIIETIAPIVPLRVLDRADGRIALMTEGGQVLLDDRKVELAFTAATVVDAAQILGSGLSYLGVSGRDLDPGTTPRLAGGELEVLFDLRDTDLVDSQAELDAFAQELIARIQDVSVDPTTAVGAAGLFTDGGASVGAVSLPGLAQRLELNSAVDVSAGGELRRLRDGLGSAAPGPDGDAAILNAIRDAIGVRQAPLSASLGAAPVSVLALSDRVVAAMETRLSRAETDRVNAESFAGTLRKDVLAQGVNTDDEMQSLLLIEQAYAANARVIQTADAMIMRLLEI